MILEEPKEFLMEFGINYIDSANPNTSHLYQKGWGVYTDGSYEFHKWVYRIRRKSKEKGQYTDYTVEGATWLFAIIPSYHGGIRLITKRTDWDKLREELLRVDDIRNRVNTLKEKYDMLNEMNGKIVTSADELYKVTDVCWRSGMWPISTQLLFSENPKDLEKFFKEEGPCKIVLEYLIEFVWANIYLQTEKGDQKIFARVKYF